MSEPHWTKRTEPDGSDARGGGQQRRPAVLLGKKVLRELLATLLPAIVLALLLTHFVGHGEIVEGFSMEPNLHTGQRVIIEKVSYLFVPPQRGDIVLVDVDDSEIPLIKRIVGLPGETLQIKDNRVYVDGRPLDEPYLDDVLQRDYGPIAIPPGHVFVMGDNRENSRDSRYIGPVSIDRLLGRAILSYWPLHDFGPLR